MDMIFCFTFFISLITILSSLFMKIPQIVKLCTTRSTRGIYIQAMLLEIMGYTIAALYNLKQQYSIVTYLEYPILLMQQCILVYMALKFKHQLFSPHTIFGSLLYMAVVFLLLEEIIPTSVLGYLISLCLPLSGIAKVSYVYGIIKAKNADSVSLTTWAISVLTNLSRLFTVYMDSADTKLIFNFSASILLSLSVYLTALYYKRADLKLYKNGRYHHQPTRGRARHYSHSRANVYMNEDIQYDSDNSQDDNHEHRD